MIEDDSILETAAEGHWRGLGLVGIMQQPAVIRSFSSDHLLDHDELDGMMPTLLEARSANVEKAKEDGKPESVSP